MMFTFALGIYLSIGLINAVSWALRGSTSPLELLFFILLWPLQVVFAVAMLTVGAIESLYTKVSGG